MWIVATISMADFPWLELARVGGYYDSAEADDVEDAGIVVQITLSM